MKIFLGLIAVLVTGCLGETEISNITATQVSCEAGADCSFDFDVSDKEKAAISARFFNEAGELECVDVEHGEFDWSINEDVLSINVENKSANDYKIVITWKYENINDCDVEISADLQDED